MMRPAFPRPTQFGQSPHEKEEARNLNHKAQTKTLPVAKFNAARKKELTGNERELREPFCLSLQEKPAVLACNIDNGEWHSTKKQVELR